MARWLGRDEVTKWESYISLFYPVPKENEGKQAAKAKWTEARWRAAVGLLGSLVEIPPRDWKGWGPRCWAGVRPSRGQSRGAAEPQRSRPATEVRTSHHETATGAATTLCQLCLVFIKKAI